MSEDVEPGTPSARELVRKRSRSYARDQTGRHHHIGAAPELQPLLDDNDGSSYVRTSDVQLAGRTLAQLTKLKVKVEGEMAAAADDLLFERAAALRDDLARITVELVQRGAGARHRRPFDHGEPAAEPS